MKLEVEKTSIFLRFKPNLLLTKAHAVFFRLIDYSINKLSYYYTKDLKLCQVLFSAFEITSN